MNYTKAPLPFRGQKRTFAKEFAKQIAKAKDDAIIIDLFGGSGLLSRIAKDVKPNSTVIYNDYDNFKQRLDSIDFTNELLRNIKNIITVGKKCKIPDYEKTQIDKLLLEANKTTFVDFITIGASLLFSGKHALSVEELTKHTYYNVCKKDVYEKKTDYLDGIVHIRHDFQNVYNMYRNCSDVVFILDPPYLSTESGSYTSYWKLDDHLNFLECLKAQKFIFFSSSKSSIAPFFNKLQELFNFNNPLDGAIAFHKQTVVNKDSHYVDQMFVKLKS